MTSTENTTRLPTLKEARRAADQTQQELAERTRLSIATIRDLEQGHRTTIRARTLLKLCEALGVDPDRGFSGLTVEGFPGVPYQE